MAAFAAVAVVVVAEEAVADPFVARGVGVGAWEATAPITPRVGVGGSSRAEAARTTTTNPVVTTDGTGAAKAFSSHLCPPAHRPTWPSVEGVDMAAGSGVAMAAEGEEGEEGVVVAAATGDA